MARSERDTDPHTELQWIAGKSRIREHIIEVIDIEEVRRVQDRAPVFPFIAGTGIHQKTAIGPVVVGIADVGGGKARGLRQSFVRSRRP